MAVNLPNPGTVTYQLQQAIAQNKRPQLLLIEFLTSNTKEANYLGNAMVDNRQAIRILTSPAGRKWIQYWLEDTLNYLQAYAEQAGR